MWLYGKRSAGIDPVVQTQNPDLNTLRRVVAKPEALSVLRRTNRLEVAYAVAVGDKQRFWNSLTTAKVELQNAKATVTTGYAGELDLFDVMIDILLYAETIKSEMETKLLEADQPGTASRPRRRRS